MVSYNGQSRDLNDIVCYFSYKRDGFDEEDDRLYPRYALLSYVSYRLSKFLRYFFIIVLLMSALKFYLNSYAKLL